MRCVAIVLVVVCVELLLAWAYVSRETTLRGDDFKVVSVVSSTHDKEPQVLYAEDRNYYCIRVDRPVGEEKFCVPKSDLEIHNSSDGSAKLGIVDKGDMVLKEGRYPGARREAF